MRRLNEEEARKKGDDTKRQGFWLCIHLFCPDASLVVLYCYRILAEIEMSKNQKRLVGCGDLRLQ